MREPNYFVAAYETRRGRRARYWRQQLRNLALSLSIAILAVALLAGCISAYAALDTPFPLI
jgi:hypothetical protein